MATVATAQLLVGQGANYDGPLCVSMQRVEIDVHLIRKSNLMLICQIVCCNCFNLVLQISLSLMMFDGFRSSLMVLCDNV